MPRHHMQLWEMTPLRRNLEYIVRFFVFYAVATYFLEVQLSDSHRSEGFWLWNERIIAIAFTLEYIVRWVYSDHKREYPFRFLSVIDLLSILPFYVGFFVDDQTLEIIRTLRILRLLKLVRHNPALSNVVQGIGKVRNELLMVGYVVGMVLLFSSSLIYQFEKEAQPDKFTKPSDAIWWCFVTLTTVGYGDLAPVTIAGRVVAVITMIIGLGIFGIFISLIGSAFVTSLKEHNDEQQRIADRDMQQKNAREGAGDRPPVQEKTPLGTR